ncbi:DJ-1/PfpI family protein [Bacillus salitolerans]|uniref:DJ-1/PfpI family protein n=1 Tax=Bacillus salitolerans TaxID=1437434 RepID=A0ABW4LVJ2_9BACI
MGKVAFFVYDQFAMWQVALLQKFLVNKGYTIETVSIGGGLISSDGGMLISSTSMEGKDPNQYDIFLMAGGEITEELLQNVALLAFIKGFEGVIAASCASSVLVAAAGKLQGKYTTLPHINEHFRHYYQEGTYIDTECCVDGNIITSRGHAHYDFMIAVLEKIGLSGNDPRLQKIALKLSKNGHE